MIFPHRFSEPHSLGEKSQEVLQSPAECCVPSYCMLWTKLQFSSLGDFTNCVSFNTNPKIWRCSVDSWALCEFCRKPGASSLGIELCRPFLSSFIVGLGGSFEKIQGCLSILMTDNLTCFMGASFKEINILTAEPLAVDSFLVLRNVIFFVLAWIRPQSTSWSLSWIFICQYFHISSYYHTAAYVISLFCVYACRQFYECSCNKRKVWEHIKRQWNPHCESRPFFSFFSFNI